MGKDPLKNLSNRDDLGEIKNKNDLIKQQYQQEFKIKSDVVQRDDQSMNNDLKDEKINRTFNGVQQEVNIAEDFEGFERGFQPDLGIVGDRLNNMIGRLNDQNNSLEPQYNVKKSIRTLQTKLGNISISTVRSFVIESSNDPENKDDDWENQKYTLQQQNQQNISNDKALNESESYEDASQEYSKQQNSIEENFIQTKQKHEKPKDGNQEEENFDVEKMKSLLAYYNQLKKHEEERNNMKESSKYDFTVEDEKRLDENLAYLSDAIELDKRNQQNLSMKVVKGCNSNLWNAANIASGQSVQNAEKSLNFDYMKSSHVSGNYIDNSKKSNSNSKSNKISDQKPDLYEGDEQTEKRERKNFYGKKHLNCLNDGSSLKHLKRDPDHNPQKDSGDFNSEF